MRSCTVWVRAAALKSLGTAEMLRLLEIVPTVGLMMTTTSPFFAIESASSRSERATEYSCRFLPSATPPICSSWPYAAKSPFRSLCAFCCALSIITVRVR